MPKGPEVGLMVTESLFGILTSAGSALIPYYLLLKPLASGGGLEGASVDPGLINLVFVLTFSAVPLAISQQSSAGERQPVLRHRLVAASAGGPAGGGGGGGASTCSNRVCRTAASQCC